MRRLGIEISGNYDSAAIKEATAGVETFGRTANEAATKNIERLAAQRVKLQELAGEYRAVAASSERGSAQQIAALDLVTKAEARLGLAVQKRAGETRIAEREIAKFTRGAASSSGSFGRMGLGLALGSGGFIAGAGAVGGIKVAIDAAKQLMTAQEQLSVAAHNVGVQLDAKQLDAYLASETKVSLFTKAELTSSLIGLVRATKSVSQAQTDASLAANIARATGKDLADVTQGLINLEGGRTRSLVALGVKIPVIKTATDALTASGKVFTGQQRAEAAALDRAATAAEGKRILLERYHGSSERFAKSDAAAQDKLRVAENLLATSIGTVLLPVVSQIADPFAKWAQKEADSGDAARKTKEIVGDLTTVMRDAKSAIHLVDDVTGSFTHTLELLIGLSVASKVSAWATAFQGFATKMTAAVAETRLLSAGLLGLPALVVTTVVVYEERKKIKDAIGHAINDTNTSSSDLLPVQRNGKWVNPITGKAVPDQAYWNAHGRASADLPPGSSRGDMRGAGSGAVLTPAQIHASLIRNGASKQEADYLTAISGREDASGRLGALNNNASTGDYSVGLFQVNYFGKLLASRSRQFGSPSALAGSADAQAKAALAILHGQGPSAWSTNTPAIQALLGISGGGGDALAALIAGGKNKVKHLGIATGCTIVRFPRPAPKPAEVPAGALA